MRLLLSTFCDNWFSTRCCRVRLLVFTGVLLVFQLSVPMS